MSAASVEREVKLRFDSVEEARRAVIGAGCTPRLGRRLQADALLDTDDEQLRRRRCVLRVRVENGKSRVTFKGPVQPSTMKVREEDETLVGSVEDAWTTMALVEALFQSSATPATPLAQKP